MPHKYKLAFARAPALLTTELIVSRELGEKRDIELAWEMNFYCSDTRRASPGLLAVNKEFMGAVSRGKSRGILVFRGLVVLEI